MNKDVIIACDFPDADTTLKFLEQFGDLRPFVKIGMELYYGAGPDIVRRLRERGHRIFLDLKLHDIPNTVRKSMKVLAGMDIDMINVHAGGTIEMMAAGLQGLEEGTPEGRKRPLLIAVTQLTSTSPEALKNQLLIDTPMNWTAWYARPWRHRLSRRPAVPSSWPLLPASATPTPVPTTSRVSPPPNAPVR